MSQGHSDVIHYTRPAGASPTDDVELFMHQAMMAGTVKIIECAKPFIDAGGGIHYFDARFVSWNIDSGDDMTPEAAKGWIGPWPETGIVNM